MPGPPGLPGAAEAEAVGTNAVAAVRPNRQSTRHYHLVLPHRCRRRTFHHDHRPLHRRIEGPRHRSEERSRRAPITMPRNKDRNPDRRRTRLRRVATGALVEEMQARGGAERLESSERRIALGYRGLLAHGGVAYSWHAWMCYQWRSFRGFTDLTPRRTGCPFFGDGGNA